VNQNEAQNVAAATEELRQGLVAGGSAEIGALRQLCMGYFELANDEAGKEYLGKIYQSIRSLGTRAALAGCNKIARLTAAMEAMLFDQLFRLNQAMSASSIHTLVQGVDCLDRLFKGGNISAVEPACQSSVLLVDDDQICNMANEVALKRASYDSAGATGAGAALTLLNDYTFDLILLDIDMPGMNGLELCHKLRSLPHHQHTPVIFVTQHGDFENRERAVRSGGDDLIAKPISPLELIVKSTVFLLSTTKPPAPDQPPRFRSSKSPPAAAAQPAPKASKDSADAKKPGGPMEAATADAGSAKSSTLQQTVREKLQHLREALAEETKRREEVERQAIENAERRRKLEAAIEENQRSQVQFQELVEQSQRQAADAGADQKNLAGRRRALVEVSDFVAHKVARLKQALEEETKRRELLEQQMGENAERRTELEAALAEIQGVQGAFQKELESAQNPKQLLELQAALTQSQEARKNL
jgi:DNA-binding response OmpR family regulator